MKEKRRSIFREKFPLWDKHLTSCEGFGRYGSGRMSGSILYEWIGLPYAETPPWLQYPPIAYKCKKCGIEVWILARGDWDPESGEWAVPGMAGCELFLKELKKKLTELKGVK